MCSVDNPYRQIWKRSISRSLLNSLCSDFRTKSMWGERGWGPLRYKTSYSRRLLLLQRKKAPRIEDGRQIASFRQKIKRTNAALTPPSADRMFGGAAGARIFWALKRLCCAARPCAPGMGLLLPSSSRRRRNITSALHCADGRKESRWLRGT